MTNIQFFTEKQANLVSDFAKTLYEEDRSKRSKEYEASEEFKTHCKEFQETDYYKELMEDKTAMLENYDKLFSVKTSLKEIIADDASVNRLLTFMRDPNYYLNNDRISGTIQSIELRQLKDFMVI